LDSTVSGQGPVAGCCECGDEPSGSCATELVSYTTKGCTDIIYTNVLHVWSISFKPLFIFDEGYRLTMKLLSM
jgi:hypothetical protein